MRLYKVLKQNTLKKGNLHIIPIRHEDRLLIMKWRNEQLYHLRQEKPLTTADQDLYFKEIENLFLQNHPKQILFSYMEESNCIGYGGLVHINWESKNAEISFLMATEKEAEGFEFHWENFLELIERVAFDDLNFTKIYTYSYDIRPRLYPVLKKLNYKKEAELINHHIIDLKHVNILIHSKFSLNDNL